MYCPKYEKSLDIYPQITERMNKAIENAKRLEQFQLSNLKEIGTTEANPSTELYKLVEYLLSREEIKKVST